MKLRVTEIGANKFIIEKKILLWWSAMSYEQLKITDSTETKVYFSPHKAQNKIDELNGTR